MRPKPRQCLVADVHKGERKIQCYKIYAVTTWNIRSMNQGKVEIVKQTTECLNITVFVVSKWKWNGMGHFHSGNYNEFYSENDKLRRNGVPLILRQDVA